jgi:hypothetical protein
VSPVVVLGTWILENQESYFQVAYGSVYQRLERLQSPTTKVPYDRDAKNKKLGSRRQARKAKQKMRLSFLEDKVKTS